MLKTRPRKGAGFLFGLIVHAGTLEVVPFENDPGEPVAIPITGELDLHAFRPAEIASLLDEYFAACQARGIGTVRVIHGKGIGTLRATVHAHLRASPRVRQFALGNETSGGWGATRVTLNLPVST